jgi:predicted nuclease with TOPRIM domain
VKKLEEECRLGYQVLADLAKITESTDLRKDSEFDRLEAFCAEKDAKIAEQAEEIQALVNRQAAKDEEIERLKEESNSFHDAAVRLATRYCKEHADEIDGAEQPEVCDLCAREAAEARVKVLEDQCVRFRQALNYVSEYPDSSEWPEEVVDAITEAGEEEV